MRLIKICMCSECPYYITYPAHKREFGCLINCTIRGIIGDYHIHPECSLEKVPGTENAHLDKIAPLLPDLTKLREVYEKYKHLNTVLCDERIGLLSLESNIRYDLWQAVKELLEEGEKQNGKS